MDNVKYVTKLISGENLYYLKDTEARANLIDKTEKGAAGGVATLDNSGKVPSSQLPSGGGSVYTLPIASANTLGGVKVGTNLYIDNNGVLSTNNVMALSGYTVIDSYGTEEEHYDLDDLTTVGQYSMTDAEKYGYFDNTPTTTASAFEIEVSSPISGIVKQRFSQGSTVFSRSKDSNGVWSDWVRVEVDIDHDVLRLTNYINIQSWATSEQHYSLNSLTETGSYAITNNANAVYFDDRPVTLATAFYISVFKTRDSTLYLCQRYQQSSDTIVYERYSSNSGSTWGEWHKVQGDLDNYVTGPESSTDANVAVFNGATGKVLKDSGITLASKVSKLTVADYTTAGTNYTVFASVSASSTSRYKDCTVLLSGGGNYYSNGYTGSWLIEMRSSTSGTPKMNVKCLAEPSGTVTFGYYTADGVTYFGIKATTRRSEFNVTTLMNNSNLFTINSQSAVTTEPEGWTAATETNLLSASDFLSNDKGTSIDKIMVADSNNEVGYTSAANLASVLGVAGMSSLDLGTFTITTEETTRDGEPYFCIFFKNTSNYKCGLAIEYNGNKAFIITSSNWRQI